MKISERIPTQFHESFALSRPSLTQILKAVVIAPVNINLNIKSTREAYFKQNTTIGNNYIKSMPNYGKGTGLLKFDHRLSQFGKSSISSDILLDQLNTQWLMHYHLSGVAGPGPVFWHELVKTRFRTGDEFTTQEITDQISEVFLREEGKSLSERSARSTATIFLGTYTRPEGLGNLNLLKEISKDRYQVLDPEPPSIWVIAYAILHWWSSLFPNLITINLNDLFGEQGLTEILMVGRGRLNTVLDEMQEEGFIQLFRVAPPYQVALLQNDEGAVLRKIYGD